MVHELATYERSPAACRLTGAQLAAALFADPPALFGHVAVDPGTDEPVGFALWFLNYSTWDGVHGIYLEDLYVRPQARGTGAGRALLAALATICVERGYSRLQWWVLDWNESAWRFYAAIGAVPMRGWTVHRLSDEALRRLGSGIVHADVPDPAMPRRGSTEPPDVELA
jgi:GNAT superfamily N-acetyltransferase